MNLPEIYQKHYKTGVGAEIGVFRGEFTEKIFSVWKGKIILVDSYKDSVPGLDMVDAALEMMERLKDKPKVTMMADSLEVAECIPSDLLDFVYIDADHIYEAVKADLAAWIPKVRKGGIVSGHDYFDGKYLGIDFGVKRAVDELGVKINVIEGDTYEGVRFDQWWFVK